MSDLNLRLRVYSASGVRGRVLQTSSLELSQVFGDVMTTTASFSEQAFGELEFPFVAAVEYSFGENWGEISNARMIFSKDSVDTKNPSDVKKLTGVAYVPWMMMRNRVQWSFSSKNGQRTWKAATPGRIIKSLWDEATIRGWGGNLDYTFTATADSDGVPWVTQDLEMTYSHGTPLWQVLTGLVEQGVVEFMTVGNTLRLFNPGRGHDWTTGSPVVNLQGDATSIPVARDFDSVFTDLTFQGDGDLLVPAHNAAAPTTFGRLEGWVQQAGVTTTAGAQALSAKALKDAQAPKRQTSVTKYAQDSTALPWATYGIGDWVNVRTTAGVEKLRVAQIVASVDADGVTEVQTILGNRYQDLLYRLAKNSGSQTGGSVSGGNGKYPIQMDWRQPAAPTGLHLNTEGYWDQNGAALGQVTVEWDEVIQGDNGEPISVGGYEVWMRDSGAGYVSRTVSRTAAGDRSVVIDQLPVGATRYFSVLAVSAAGVSGILTAEVSVTIPPPPDTVPVPTPPVLTEHLSVISVGWDGKLGTGTGSAPPRWFRNVYPLMSTTETGAYSRVAQTFNSAGAAVVADLPSNQTFWFKLVAVDTLGRESAPSAPRSATTTGVSVDDAAQDLLDQIDAALQAGTDAQASADGKNTITYSTSDPSGGGVPGDTWFKRAPGGFIVIGQWEYDGASWVPQTLSHEVISSVDAGTITVGELDGQIIRANTILSTQMLMGDFTNLIDDPTYAAAALNSTNGTPAWAADAGVPYTVTSPPAGSSWRAELRYTSDGSTGDKVFRNSRFVTCKPGDKFYVSAGVRASSSATQFGWAVYAQLADGSMVAVDWVYDTTGAPRTKTITAPANAVYLQFAYVVRSGSAAGVAFVFYNPIMRRTLDAELVVDGTITTAMLAAGSITTNKLDAGAIDGMTITGALIRTAASGQRVELSSANGLRGFNAGGTVITQISAAGVLTATGATITGTLQTGTSGARAVMTGSGVTWYSSTGAVGGAIAAATGSGTAIVSVTSGASTLFVGKTDMPRAGTADVSSPTNFFAPSLLNGNGWALPVIYVGTFIDNTTIAAGSNHNTGITFPTGVFNAPPAAVLVTPSNARFTPAVSSITASGATVSLSNWSTAAGIPGSCGFVAFGN